MLPWIAIVVGALAGLWLMTRKNKTWGTRGIFLGLAITVGLGALLGWYLDRTVSFTTLVRWGLSGGTTLFLGTLVYVSGIAVALGGMAASAYKAGQFVS